MTLTKTQTHVRLYRLRFRTWNEHYSYFSAREDSGKIILGRTYIKNARLRPSFVVEIWENSYWQTATIHTQTPRFDPRRGVTGILC